MQLSGDHRVTVADYLVDQSIKEKNDVVVHGF